MILNHEETIGANNTDKGTHTMKEAREDYVRFRVKK